MTASTRSICDRLAGSRGSRVIAVRHYTLLRLTLRHTAIRTFFRCRAFLAIAPLLILPASSWAADPDGNDLYKQHCAACHDASGATRAPAPAALKLMSPENIVKTLESGVMKDQGASLNAIEKQKVAEFLTGKVVGAARVAATGDGGTAGADKTSRRHSARKASGTPNSRVPGQRRCPGLRPNGVRRATPTSSRLPRD